MSHRFRDTLPAALLAAAVAARSAPAQDAAAPLLDPRLGPLVAAAVERAAERLSSPGCALVLADFEDARTGTSLAETLAATGRTPAEYVRSIRFRGSEGLRKLEGLRVFAFTSPGSDEVFVCHREFARIQTHRRLAAAVIIHELLHTLGLADDVPSPAAVTHRVLARCG